MWRCRICEKKTKKRANIVRHLKLIHGIDDIDFKNVIKDTNIGVGSYETDRSPLCSNGLQSRMTEKGRPLSEDYREIPYKVSRLTMEGPQTEEKYEYDPRSISEMDEHLTESEFHRLGEQLRNKKSSVLNSVLEMMPDNLKYRAKSICDKLMGNDFIFLNDKYQIIVRGEIIANSNICTKIIEALTSCPNPGASIQPTRPETKLKPHVPRNGMRESESMKPEKSQNIPGITKFETLFGNGGGDSDKSEEEDAEDDEEYDEGEYEEEDDMDEDEEEEEPSRKRKTKN